RELGYRDRRRGEGQHERAHAHDGNRALRRRPGERERAVHDEPEERQRRHHPEQGQRRRGHQPLSRLMFCKLTVCRWREMASMIASPTPAAAAATAITKKTKIG